MKNLAIFSLLVFFMQTALAQSFELFYEEEEVTGHTLQFQVNPDEDPAVVHLEVENTSTAAIDVKVKKIEDQIVAGTNVSLCWGVNCYSPSQFVTPTAATIDAGAYDDSFHGDYYHLGNTGTSIVTYVFFDDANPEDSVFVTVEYILEGLGLEDVELLNFSAPYPNPAKDFVNFYYSVNDGTSLFVFNTLGKLVETFELSPLSNNLKINTSAYAPGTYFYEYKKGNVILDKGKIIISQ